MKIDQEASARLAQNARTRTNIEIVDNSYVAGAALGPRDLSLQVGHAGVDGEFQRIRDRQRSSDAARGAKLKSSVLGRQLHRVFGCAARLANVIIEPSVIDRRRSSWAVATRLRRPATPADRRCEHRRSHQLTSPLIRSLVISDCPRKDRRLRHLQRDRPRGPRGLRRKRYA